MSCCGAIRERVLTLTPAHVRSNHGTFYYNQLAALQVLVGDNAGAQKTLEEYFTTQYKWQIVTNGDQVSARPTARK